MRKIVFLFILLFCSWSLIYSQIQIKSTFEGKHHMLSTDELHHTSSGKAFIETEPPTGYVRSIAEFERNQGVIVSRPSWGGFGIPLELISSLSQEVMVYVVVANSSANSTVISSLEEADANMQNISIINIAIDSYWSRDYSPWFIAYGNSPQIGIVDFPYNRPSRVNDDEFPVEIADYFDLPVFGMNLIHTGGNYMSDGMGVAASSKLVETENESLSTSEIEQLAEDYLGISNYYLIDDPLGEYIEHVDCWGKFLDVDKILIAQVPENDSRYDDFEAVADYWENQTSSYGNKYQVYRVYAPNGQPYTNSLIMNDRVYVALVTETGSEWNDEALDVYENAMPGYEIIGMYNNTSHPWEATDALHCRAHEVPDFGMLYMNHIPYYDTVDMNESFDFSVEILPYSGENVVAGSVKLHYRIDDGTYSFVVMQQSIENVWTCNIDDFSYGDVIDYYIEAADESGRNATHPLIGQADPHHFVVDEASSIITSNSEELSIYPNPARDRISVVSEGSSGLLNFSIIDLNGKIILNGELMLTDEWQRQFINISELKPGVYSLILGCNDRITSKRFIVY